MKAMIRIRASCCAPAGAAAVLALLACFLSDAAPAQPPAQPTPAATAPAATQTPAAARAAKSAPKPAPAADAARSAGITEDELRQLLVGKTFYLRGGYLDDSLNFNEHGGMIGHSPVGSYTLCMVEIEKVRLTKHKVELDGMRYGLHFLGALPYEDPASAVDRVRITPKKKVLHISIDRELVVKPKKVKAEKPAKGAKPTAQSTAPLQAGAGAATPGTSAGGEKAASDADELKAEIAAAPATERPADAASVTTTTSPAHSAQVLKDALDNIFAAGLDARMMATMPEFWKLYYQAAAAKSDYRPSDPAVQRQSTVDTKARLVSSFEPDSNEYAQQAGVAGMALYHAVIGADGTAQEIAVGRPIGFGLDENAVAAIRKAKFEPAMKEGKPVPVLLDLVVEFRIYSKRTAAVAATPKEAGKAVEPSLPGPYSIPHPQ